MSRPPILISRRSARPPMTRSTASAFCDSSICERKDVIVVSSVSCIYGLGAPEEFFDMMISLRPGMEKDRDDVIRELIDIQYNRNEMVMRGTFRVRGDVLTFLQTIQTVPIRVEFFGDEIDRITELMY